MKQLLPLITSAFTILGMWLAGNKDKRTWVVGLANQGLWIAFIFAFKAWGLLPLAGFLIVIYSRNLAKWHKEARP